MFRILLGAIARMLEAADGALVDVGDPPPATPAVSYNIWATPDTEAIRARIAAADWWTA